MQLRPQCPLPALLFLMQLSKLKTYFVQDCPWYHAFKCPDPDLIDQRYDGPEAGMAVCVLLQIPQQQLDVVVAVALGSGVMGGDDARSAV